MTNQTEQQSEKPLTNSTNIHNLVYLADRGGTGWWRHIQAIDVFGAVQRHLGIYNTYTEQFIADPNYYRNLNSVTLQRWSSHSQREAFEKFLLPVTRASKTAIIYAIDDAMGAKDIPLYNAGRAAFQPEQVQEDIKFMLNNSDLVVVTTKHLKEYYNREYGVPMEKLVAVPNMLPAFWFGDRYDIDKKMVQFGENKAKPRVGIIGSLSHFNYKKVLGEDGKPVPDDLDMVVDVIRKTVDDFQWVVLGTVPEQLKDLVQKGKIECYGCCPILSYPSFLCGLNLQAAVAPLRPMEFNYCKSPIKHLECSAIGVPLFAQNCLPYKGVVPENQLFDDQNDLQEKLMKLKFSSMGAYKKMVEHNWNLINAPHEDGDFQLQTSWMENNLGVWMSIFKFNPFKDAEQASGGNDNG